MPPVHVERAALEDLSAIWQFSGSPNERPALMAAVEQRQCLVAKRGWAVLGYAVRKPDFFGFPLITAITAAPEQDHDAVVRALFDYAERTAAADRVFTSAPESNTIMQALFTSMGYQPCGTVDGVNPNGEREHVYCKILA